MPVRRSSVTGMPNPTPATSSSTAARASSTASTIVAISRVWSSPNAWRRTRWRTARSGPTTPARSLVPPRSTPMTQLELARADGMGAATIPTSMADDEPDYKVYRSRPRLLRGRDDAGDGARGLEELRAPRESQRDQRPPAQDRPAADRGRR